MNESRGNAQTRFPLLDILRGFAILGVVYCHLIALVVSEPKFETGSKNENFIYFMQLGRYGVELFFFISGYLLSKLYAPAEQTFSFKQFLARRLFRILPLWVLFGVLGFLEFRFFNFGPWVGLSSSPNDYLGIGVMTLTFSLYFSSKYWSLIPGGWSIQTEIFQYYLFPWLKKTSTRYQSIICLIWLYLIINFLKPLFPNYSIPWNVITAVQNLSLVPSVLFFLAGIIIAEINWDSIRIEDFQRHLKERYFLVVTVLISLSLSFFTNQVQRNIAEGIFMVLLYSTLASFFSNFSTLRKIFSWIGTHSYFIYFFHFQVILLLAHFAKVRESNPFYGNLYLETLSLLILVMILCVPMAELSMRLLEKPLIRYGHRIS